MQRGTPHEGRRTLAEARRLEAKGDLTGALSAYQAALDARPDDPGILTGIGRLALALDMAPAAESVLKRSLAFLPSDPEATSLLARSLSAQGRSGQAIDVLREQVLADPLDARIWNQLGLLVAEQGDLASAETFLREALRLKPNLTPARFNLGNLQMSSGDATAALETFLSIREGGLTSSERAILNFSRACARLRLGDLARGWTDYAARNDPAFPGAAAFDIPGRRWRRGQPLSGLDLLLVGEQGLGDEVLFAGLVPDLMVRLGPEGSLSLAVEPRLQPLFRRAFPAAQVISHATVETGGRKIRRLATAVKPATWAPMADLLFEFRPEADAFPERVGYLPPDPDRVAFWRRALGAELPGPRVGLLWKSGMMTAGRANAFPSFEAWEPVLRTPGIAFVNLQYGDCAPEIALAGERFGLKVWTPPDIDLRNDLEDLSALSCALDLVVGVSNATFNLAAAAGAPAWLVAAPDAWTTLGTDRYPWYPQVRVHSCARPGDWVPVMEAIASDLRQYDFAART